MEEQKIDSTKPASPKQGHEVEELGQQDLEFIKKVEYEYYVDFLGKNNKHNMWLTEYFIKIDD